MWGAGFPQNNVFHRTKLLREPLSFSTKKLFRVTFPPKGFIYGLFHGDKLSRQKPYPQVARSFPPKGLSFSWDGNFSQNLCYVQSFLWNESFQQGDTFLQEGHWSNEFSSKHYYTQISPLVRVRYFSRNIGVVASWDRWSASFSFFVGRGTSLEVMRRIKDVPLLSLFAKLQLQARKVETSQHVRTW